MNDRPNSIHQLGLVGHIEDIVVNKDQQGKKLGLRIIEALDYIAGKVGCYKVSSSKTFWGPRRKFRLRAKPGRQLLFLGGPAMGLCVCSVLIVISCRPSWIARRRTKASTSSVGTVGQGWRWRIITSGRMDEALRDCMKALLCGTLCVKSIGL